MGNQASKQAKSKRASKNRKSYINELENATKFDVSSKNILSSHNTIYLSGGQLENETQLLERVKYSLNMLIFFLVPSMCNFRYVQHNRRMFH